MAGPNTPVMQQHAAAKRAHPDAVIFFRLGDFYEMFGDDAVVCARALDLSLTSRNRGKPDEVPMAGVPHHAAHQYIAKLLELGHKVAICEQMADPSMVKGIVPREVVRVITPGLVTDRDQLDARSNNWLAAIELGAAGVGIALFDLSTGELCAAEVSDLTRLLSELCRSAPREILVGADGAAGAEHALQALRRAVPRAALRPDPPLAEGELDHQLGARRGEAAFAGALGSKAAARVLRFARSCTPGAELPLRRVARWDPRAELVIDAVAQRHLELCESWSGLRQATLLGVIDDTQTPMGARLLRRRLSAPLIDVEQIRRRHDQVELFVVHAKLRTELRRALGDVTDLERIVSRASLGEVNPRELGSLRDGLCAAARASEVLGMVHDAAGREVLGLSGKLDLCVELADELRRALVERPPAQAKEGTVFASGYDAELSELDALQKNGAERMVELETRLRESTGIPTLKLRYTRVFGWYIEVSRAHAAKAPSGWRRKQTVATGERYTNPELDDLADRITTAEERHRERELELIRRLVRAVADAGHRIVALSECVAQWDVASSLAEVAHRYDYTRPVVDDSDQLELEESRHPVVERLAAQGRFVPNDVHLSLGAERLWLITGPNMAGKSTLLRQTALSVVMAQLGSFVPARRARIGVVDRVLSRVGASDDVARGESTFMVEMRETAEILKTATRRSLVILDEIGRGTSTYDGLAIAWAVAEHIDQAVQCRALFATHYHELTALAAASDHVANHSVSARESGDDVVFLHRLVAGAASRSYGIAVARLAGLPESVLARARAILIGLEGEGTKPRRPGATEPQLSLFQKPEAHEPGPREVIDTLRALEVDRMTPLDALSLLAKLKAKLT
ncbi:MAG: DNA mismatch repair protein MutS [Polyangiaceae bacterium]|nr:DNA mismatch repair protein MutS [Polyangiaceae bacterium]